MKYNENTMKYNVFVKLSDMWQCQPIFSLSSHCSIESCPTLNIIAGDIEAIYSQTCYIWLGIKVSFLKRYHEHWLLSDMHALCVLRLFCPLSSQLVLWLVWLSCEWHTYHHDKWKNYGLNDANIGIFWQSYRTYALQSLMHVVSNTWP